MTPDQHAAHKRMLVFARTIERGLSPDERVQFNRTRTARKLAISTSARQKRASSIASRKDGAK